MLRMPGTLNNKRARPFRVRMVDDEWPMDRMDYTDWASIPVRPAIRNSPTQVDSQASDIDWDDVAKLDPYEVRRKYPRARVGKYCGPCEKGKQSDVRFLIADGLAKAGASPNEIACVVAASGAYNGREDIERICAKLRSGQ
jgi:hypothetical protein